MLGIDRAVFDLPATDGHDVNNGRETKTRKAEQVLEVDRV
jgi:hypothetical protein